MGSFRAEEMQRLWVLIQSAPFPVISVLSLFVTAAATAGWWSRGQVTDRRITGLEQQLAVRDERLKAAEEKAQAQREARLETERQFNELKAQLQPETLIAARLDALEAAFAKYQATSKAFEGSFVRADLRATEAPDTASIKAQVH